MKESYNKVNHKRLATLSTETIPYSDRLTKKASEAKECCFDVEKHVVVSACLLVCAVACDALTSLDLPLGKVDAPSSYRVSSLVVTCILASPVLKGIDILDQRICTSILLVALSRLLDRVDPTPSAPHGRRHALALTSAVGQNLTSRDRISPLYTTER